jgi:two-component system phosphate regulon sensor histidine kinase PhoR
MRISWPHLGLVTALAAVSWLTQRLAGDPFGWLVFCAVLLFFAGQYVHHLHSLDRWLRGQDEHLPRFDGLWGDVGYRLEKLLRASRGAEQEAYSHLEEMLEVAGSLPEGIVLIEPDARIGWLNRAAERHLGLSQTRDRGQYLHYLLRDTLVTEWLRKGLDNHQDRLSFESPILPGHTLSLQLAPLPHGRLMLLSHDISDLIRIDQVRRDFVANVSHELRTPITVIAGFLEAFAELESPDPSMLKPQIGLMLEQSDRMRRLIDDLLVLARLEADLSVDDEPVDMPELLRELHQSAQSLSQGHHVIRMMLQAHAGLRGSQQEIHSACMNLVSNAVRYTPDGGTITLRWEPVSGGGMQFSVEDTGEGIEAQHIPRLTERFYRVDKGRSRQTGGTGLGLAIVKRVLLRHQARLKVESQMGRGSIFTAVFPPERVIPEPATPAQPVAAS